MLTLMASMLSTVLGALTMLPGMFTLMVSMLSTVLGALTMLPGMLTLMVSMLSTVLGALTMLPGMLMPEVQDNPNGQDNASSMRQTLVSKGLNQRHA